jgi:general secretion pathway protein A
MYAKFFGLRREPFSLAPDPRYLYMSDRHREALAHLLYGVDAGGGFVLLTGEIGAGKTTVCRCFLEQIPKRCNVAYIYNPKLTVIELLRTICDEFGVPYEANPSHPPTVKDYVDPLNEFLLKTHAVGQNNVLIIDEAQNLSPDVLEQLRLLTNLETTERKLLQIILIGQPELRTMLARPELEQLAQRVIARFHLDALNESETSRYIRHRLSVAGLSRPLPFDRDARKRVFQLSRGIPRRINLLCDRAMLGAFASGKPKVDRETVDRAAGEVFEKSSFGTWKNLEVARPRTQRALLIGGGALAGALVLALGLWAWKALLGSREGPVSAKAAPTAAQAVAAPQARASAAGAVASAAPVPVASPQPLVAPLVAVASLDAAYRHEREALRDLAGLWKMSLSDGDPCALAQRQQVLCFRSTTGLSLVRQLGRPGVIALQADGGGKLYALLVGLTPKTATLRMDKGVMQTVSLESLGRRWQGEFVTYWRTPPGYTSKLLDGNSGPAVDWLATRLAAAQGQPAPTGKQTVDAAFKARVQSFQLAQGLTPDGVAGATTFMLINRQSGVDEPRLAETTPAG